VCSSDLQAGVATNRYDEKIDRNGDQRSSKIYDMRAGIVLNFGEKLNGELAAGYVVEDYDQGSLATLEGYTFDALLNWSPSRETTVTLNASTTLNGATTTGDNGSIVYIGGISAIRQTSDRLSFNFNADFSADHNEQSNTTDTTYTIGAGAQYWMNRYMAVTADLGHTTYVSSGGTSDYDETTAMLGVKLQR